MCLILPAFSSPELKAFPLHLRHIRSFGSTPSLTTLPRAGRARLCDLFRSAFASLHKSHRLAKARIKAVAFVFLSVGLCQSRKDPYLPPEPQFVRLLPRTNVLAPMAFAVSFRIRFADAKTAVKHHRPERVDGRFRVGAVVNVVPRSEGMMVMYIFMYE